MEFRNVVELFEAVNLGTRIIIHISPLFLSHGHHFLVLQKNTIGNNLCRVSTYSTVEFRLRAECY